MIFLKKKTKTFMIANQHILTWHLSFIFSKSKWTNEGGGGKTP